MASSELIISPKTKVGELLDNYPDLEPILMKMSPAFEKLKNPILRKTVARVATLQQVAVVGGLNLDEMINRLRKEAGQSNGETGSPVSEYLSSTPPLWFDETKIVKKYDATPIINSGRSPMNEILSQTSLLKPDDIYELHTPFIPAPVLDMLNEKKFKVYCIQTSDIVLSYIWKPTLKD